MKMREDPIQNFPPPKGGFHLIKRKLWKNAEILDEQFRNKFPTKDNSLNFIKSITPPFQRTLFFEAALHFYRNLFPFS